MPVQSGTLGAFSFGRDLTLVFLHPNAPGGRIDLTNVTAFDVKPNLTTVNSTLMNGKTLEVYLPKNWNGSFEIDRGSAALDTLQSGIDRGWYSNGIIQFGTAYQIITEPDGSTSTFVFTDVAIKVDDTGRWEGDKKVTQKCSFAASTRNRV